MIENLINKTKDKKYHQSIKFFSHSLKREKRAEFIKLVASSNILLASQCIMSCEKDFELENYLATVAEIQSNKNEIQCKVNGFLSLIELNRYELIDSVLSQINKIDKIYRTAINQIISEIDSDSIIKLLRIILKTETKGLVGSLIASVENREIEFSSSQKLEIESLFTLMLSLYGRDNQRTLKYLKVFNLSKKLIPFDIERISKHKITKGAYVFIRDFYNHFDLEFPFSNKDLCEIYLTRKNQRNALAFAQCLFDINDFEIRSELLKESLKTGKHFTAFVFSLIKSTKDRKQLMLLSPDVLILNRLIIPFTYVDYPEVDQNYLVELIRDTFTDNHEIIGKIVPCKVTGTIEKTIFVDILPDKAKGSIWIKEYSDQIIDDINKYVKIGDTFMAVIIGIGDKYVQLSTKRMKTKK